MPKQLQGRTQQQEAAGMGVGRVARAAREVVRGQRHPSTASAAAAAAGLLEQRQQQRRQRQLLGSVRKQACPAVAAGGA